MQVPSFPDGIRWASKLKTPAEEFPARPANHICRIRQFYWMQVVPGAWPLGFGENAKQGQYRQAVSTVRRALKRTQEAQDLMERLWMASGQSRLGHIISGKSSDWGRFYETGRATIAQSCQKASRAR
jgi:hypothetical protein